jgi:segregation and condensation protein A
MTADHGPAATFEPDASSVEGALVLDLDGFEGPIDLLLALAREQKVDLTRISILELADQYLAFIAEVRRVRLELAADYLVMAAWLAYLKSRLLLPNPEPERDEPSGEEMAAALAFQLQRLEAMQDVGVRLFERPLLGRDIFPRGAPERISVIARPAWQASLYDVLAAYADHRRRQRASTLRIEPTQLYSMEDALERLATLLGRMPDWTSLARFLPPELAAGLLGRSALASTFAASLELAKAGRLELRQDGAFAPIYLRQVGAVR